MRPSFIRCVFITSLLGILAGCSGPYAKDLGKDAAEVLDASVGWSRGVGLNFRATRVLQAGFGSTAGDWAGLKEGRFETWSEERSELGFSLLYIHDLHRWDGGDLIDMKTPLFGEDGHTEYPFEWDHRGDRGWFDVGLRLNAIYLGLDIALKLDEFADLLCGLVGFDLLSDNAHKPSMDELLSGLDSSDPWTRYRAINALRWRTGEDYEYVYRTAPDEIDEDQARVILKWKQASAQ